jgi:hypothetical protein
MAHRDSVVLHGVHGHSCGTGRLLKPLDEDLLSAEFLAVRLITFSRWKRFS